MERLTDKNSKLPIDQDGGLCVTAAFIAKLAAYEDSGVPPEDVPTSLEMAKIYASLKKLKEYEDAEEHGRMVMLPCKVGASIYCVQYICDYKKCDSNTRMACCGCPDHTRTKYVIDSRDFALSDIDNVGETVFLTYEEAKASLNSMK